MTSIALVTCNLYKPSSGKWYGECEFPFEFEVKPEIMPSIEYVLNECRNYFSWPEEFIIHVEFRTNTFLILP